jgi:fibronectin-binding autotransporter adhesin
VAQGTLKAGAANTLQRGFGTQRGAGRHARPRRLQPDVASLANSGTVSLAGATAGTTLTVNGNYVGNNGVLKLGTALSGTGPSDRLVINGGTATGKTSVQVANLGGLGALTVGNGIEVVSAQNGATTTAQTTKDAFSAGGRPRRCGRLRVPPVRGRCERRGRELVPALDTNAATPPPGTPGTPACRGHLPRRKLRCTPRCRASCARATSRCWATCASAWATTT